MCGAMVPSLTSSRAWDNNPAATLLRREDLVQHVHTRQFVLLTEVTGLIHSGAAHDGDINVESSVPEEILSIHAGLRDDLLSGAFVETAAAGFGLEIRTQAHSSQEATLPRPERAAEEAQRAEGEHVRLDLVVDDHFAEARVDNLPAANHTAQHSGMGERFHTDRASGGRGQAR